MIILSIRTDKPEAEIGLYEGTTKLDYETWQAHRELSATLHKKIAAVLTKHGKGLKDVGGIVCYQGPGSFTGLRIGLSVANAMAYSLNIPIVARAGDDWVEVALEQVNSGRTEVLALPD